MNMARIPALDAARGLALIAMTIFHFAFDLEFFGFQEPGYINQPHWKYFARMIAGSFLFLAGVSLVFAHMSGGIRWHKWLPRFVKITVAAALVSVVTYFLTPQIYVFFGILHAIALASLLGLAFLRIPWRILVAFAVSIYVVHWVFSFDALNGWWGWWTGLNSIEPISSDYVPIIPWFGATLLGITLAKLLIANEKLQMVSDLRFDGVTGSALSFLGRHSLVYYLLHQPVLFAGFYAYLWLASLWA